METPKPPRHRSRAPSLSELAMAVAEEHDLDSDPPAARWLDRRIGRAVRLGIRWLYYTKRGTKTAVSVAAVVMTIVGWLLHHAAIVAHWVTSP